MKTGEGESSKGRESTDREEDNKEDQRKISFRDLLMGSSEDVEMMDSLDGEDGDITDDDAMEDEYEGPWFNMGMTKGRRGKQDVPRS